MNPEIWALAEREECRSILADLASEEELRLRFFDSVPVPLGIDEPAGGILLAIDASGQFGNYPAIARRFRKNFVDIDVIVFERSMPSRRDALPGDSEIDLPVPVPVDRDDFLVRAARLADLRRIKGRAGIVGRSFALNEMLDTVLQVAPTEVPVLLQGESGSGKELTALAIHNSSERSARSFETVNCGALAEGVLESELFGHEKGAFTGAVSRRRGLFERAHGGTLLLDEVGEMSLNMQVKLLRVLETGEFMRVGGMEKLHSDVRLIAATNRELDTSVDRGEFRKDLYYRLKVVQIRVPPLRARPEDIPLLATYFLRRSAKRHGRRIKGIEKRGIDLLVTYPWPGNVRELANMIDNLTVLGRDRIIRASEIEKRIEETTTRRGRSVPDLPVHVTKTREDMERELIMNSLLSLHNDVREILGILRDGRTVQGPTGRWDEWIEVEDAGDAPATDLDTLEKQAIREALARNDGNRRKAARQLGMSERTLYRRLKEYGIN